MQSMEKGNGGSAPAAGGVPPASSATRTGFPTDAVPPHPTVVALEAGALPFISVQWCPHHVAMPWGGVGRILCMDHWGFSPIRVAGKQPPIDASEDMRTVAPAWRAAKETPTTVSLGSESLTVNCRGSVPGWVRPPPTPNRLGVRGSCTPRNQMGGGATASCAPRPTLSRRSCLASPPREQVRKQRTATRGGGRRRTRVGRGSGCGGPPTGDAEIHARAAQLREKKILRPSWGTRRAGARRRRFRRRFSGPPPHDGAGGEPRAGYLLWHWFASRYCAVPPRGWREGVARGRSSVAQAAAGSGRRRPRETPVAHQLCLSSSCQSCRPARTCVRW